MTTTAASIVAHLAALSTPDVTVTAIVREGRIVVSYHVAPVDPADVDQVDAWAEQTSREIGDMMRAAGYTFGDAGGDDPGIYEVWHAAMSRRIDIYEPIGAWAGRGKAEWNRGGVTVVDCACPARDIPYDEIAECLAAYHAAPEGHRVECDTTMGVWPVTIGAREDVR